MGLGTGLIQPSGLKQPQITKLIQQPIIQPPITPPAFDLGFEGIRGFGFPIILPPLGGFMYERQAKRPKKQREFTRIPSFAAFQLGITSTKPFFGEVSGIVERPILVSGRRKKKKSTSRKTTTNKITSRKSKRR